MLRSLPNDKSAKLRRGGTAVGRSAQQIEAWWTDRRLQDEDLSETLKMEGFNQGYAEGSAKAELEMKELMEQATLQASELLPACPSSQGRSNSGSGAFLVELAAKIAEKVLDRQLTIEPDFTLELILKESGTQAGKRGHLCVAPEQFEFVYAARKSSDYRSTLRQNFKFCRIPRLRIEAA